jgi:chitinase
VAKPIVGYLYRGNPTDKQLQHMTHVAHSFAVPTNGQGGLSVNRESVLASLVPRAHAQDCKVGISIFGGLGSNTPAYNNALNSVVNHRAALVNSIMGIVDRYGLDWVDLDLEPIGEAADAFVLLLRDLRARLGSRELSAAVLAGYPWAGFKPAGFPLVDFLVIMTYDDEWPAGTPHASRAFAEHYIDMWTAAGLPVAKTLAGVPLYERPGSRDYKALVAIDRVNSQRDSTTINGTEVGYNGQPTVRWKMDKWGGVAFWEVYGDTQDDTSLLLAAYEAARPQQPDPWWGWFPERQAS